PGAPAGDPAVLRRAEPRRARRTEKGRPEGRAGAASQEDIGGAALDPVADEQGEGARAAVEAAQTAALGDLDPKASAAGHDSRGSAHDGYPSGSRLKLRA